MHDDRFSGSKTFFAAFTRNALLSTALILTLAVPAQAQFWNDAPAPKVERKKAARKAPRPAKMSEAAKEQSKPSGPVVIAISIEKQHLKIYDANGVYAESPVSTGMKGHSTPMGVFSVIGKEVFHRSNIYSGAPMPHMQRITWSGVAMHAGVLPGYPASHGCIRLPANFATRMFGWTTKGARVVIAPGELAPEDFTHRNLIVKKITLPDPNAPVVTEAKAHIPQPAPTKFAAHVPTPKTDRSVTDIGATNAQMPDVKLVTSDAPNKADEIRTADASGGVPVKTETMPDVKIETPVVADVAKDLEKAVAEATGTSEKATDRPTDKPADKAADTKPATPAAEAAPADPALPGTAQFIGPTKPRTGHIAAFISRKEGKLFVRQNFAPLFDVPVAIAPGEKPLGTHVFTARADKDEADTIRWSVVSMPAPSRAPKRDEDTLRRSKKVIAEPAPLPPPSTATEALDRITIPEDALKRIAGLIAPGGSLVVSDQGFGDETGLGTDFIVTQR